MVHSESSKKLSVELWTPFWLHSGKGGDTGIVKMAAEEAVGAEAFELNSSLYKCKLYI